MQLAHIGDTFVSRKNGERYTVEMVRTTGTGEVLSYRIVDQYDTGINVYNHPFDMDRWEIEQRAI